MRADTIFAPASGVGRAGIAVIRVSGPHAGGALVRVSGRALPTARRAIRVRIVTADGEAIDEGVALWFPGPGSFTGEDVVELHVHGGRAVTDGVLGVLAGCEGLRPAEPGEFTRRAFENGKLDLTAAEGLADLIAAETEGQRRQALRQLQGELGRLYEGWRQRLLRILAHVEAAIDFGDEDLPEGLEVRACEETARLRCEIEAHLDDGRRGERLRDGIEVAIVGPPNAGKSSLFNLLAGRSAAIVSDRPGTTRDVIEVTLDLGGYPVVMADTAGLRDDGEEVEQEGVRRARMRMRECDVILVVFDGALWPAWDQATAAVIDERAVVVVNKADLGRVAAAPTFAGRAALLVSARSGTGIEAMVAELRNRVVARVEDAGSPPLTRLRHRRALEECRDALARAATANGLEWGAEDLRLAARALGRITGRVDVEDVLDVIFRDFCIGK
ncbi:MAG: tRNA uridine-5-carboxymethylaminomethyl(34) synthesis GTPase MnmE [Rhodospirillales bacterium]